MGKNRRNGIEGFSSSENGIGIKDKRRKNVFNKWMSCCYVDVDRVDAFVVLGSLSSASRRGNGIETIQ